MSFEVDNETFAPTFSPTNTFLFDDDPFIDFSFMPDGFTSLDPFLQILVLYLCLFQIVAFIALLFWIFYPLPPDERVSVVNLISSIWSVFVLVGDYISDVLVAIAIATGDVDTLGSTDPDFKIELFTQVIVILSAISLFVSIIAMSWMGKRDSDLILSWLPFRIFMVATGLYPFQLLFELVTARYYGGTRAKLGDIVRLKYIQGTVESIPQIALLIYLNLQNFDGLRQLVGASLTFSVASLVSGLVMWDYIQEAEKDEYAANTDGTNDINYLLYAPFLSKAHLNDNPNYNKDLLDWSVHAVITRLLECIARLSFYSTFAIVTKSWGIIALVFLDMVGMLGFHGFTFFFSAWIELIFNLKDDGNVNIAVGEWRFKFATTVLGYIVIVSRVLSNQKLIVEQDAPEVVFYLGLTSNVILFPWIVYLFKRQKKIMAQQNVILERELEEARRMAEMERKASKLEQQDHPNRGFVAQTFGWFVDFF